MTKIQTTRVYAEIEQAKKAGFTTVSEQGSSRSSKSYNTVIWLVLRCFGIPGTTVSIVRATLPALKGSILRDFLEIMNKTGLYDRKKYNKSELIYEFDNGSWIEFFSCDDEQKLRGRKRKILYVNEGNELRYLEWQQLQMRTTEFSIIDYNPSFSDDHWLCQLNREKKTYHFITTYLDNPFLEQKVIDEIESLREKNPSLWRIYGLGLQAIIEGLIFKNVEIIDEIPKWAKKHRFLGIDFGYTTDPTAIIEECIINDTLYLDEKCYSTQMTSSDIVRKLKEINFENSWDFEIISESADPRLIDEIANSGLDIKPVKKFPGSIMAGITKMLEYNIKITRRSTNLIKEYKNYTYRQNREGKWLNEPIDAFNHGIDACRYIILEKVLGKNSESLTAEEILDLI